jgi:malonyl-CoA/methylmalonyl-CoA synthetase
MQLLFPPVSPFLELIQREERSPNKIILRDHSSGVSATAGQLLHSVSLLRGRLQATLLESGMYDSRNASDDKFIFLLAPPGWEYVVSMLTIFSLGVGFSPQCKQLPPATQIQHAYSNIAIVIKPEEMKRFFKLANPLALLYAPAFAQKVKAIKALCAESDSGVNQNIPFVEIKTGYPDGLASHTCKAEQNDGPHSATQTGSLFFTSGTSGNQKGVVHKYQALLASARERIETWKLTENDVVLNQKPANWMGGIFGIIPSLITGACL